MPSSLTPSILFGLAEGAEPVFPAPLHARTPQVHDRHDVAHAAAVPLAVGGGGADGVADGLAEGVPEPVRVRQHQEGGREAVVGRQSSLVRLRNDAGKLKRLG